MGLASKLAARQPQGGYGALPPQQQQQAAYTSQWQGTQKPGLYPGQAQYQAYPGGNSAPQGQYAPNPQVGQYPPFQPQSSGQYGQQYGAPPVTVDHHEVGVFKQLLNTTIQQKGLQNMIPPNHPNLDKYAQRAASQIPQICHRWELPREVGQDLVKLALFDIVLYIESDNSGSMLLEEKGERIEDLKFILSRVVSIATLFDDDGISIRFMNDWYSDPAMDGFDMHRLDGIRNEQMVEHIISKIKFVGLTPLGTELRNKVVDPLVLGPARNRQLQKPVLVITLTDGNPAGELENVIFEVIRYASNELSRMPQYGPGAISLQFAQVGNDQKAREFLAKLDSDPQVGSLIDCTSSKGRFLAGFLRQLTGRKITKMNKQRCRKRSIDSDYDTKDESSSRPHMGQSYGGPVSGPYGAPNGYGQQQYPQQGNHGQPQQQDYGSLPGQHNWYQGYGQSPNPGYGQPLQQGYGYSQQSSHNAPPPPRY
ncbi:MAG: hypothetical protein Q9179_004288 [Wetmoreana sp. 5 TL-2023]